MCETQTWPAAGSTTIGDGPPGIVLTTFAVAGSITTITPESMHGTQSWPRTTAVPSGFRFTGTEAVTFNALGSTRATRFVSCETQSDPAALVTQSAPVTSTEPVTLFVRGSTPAPVA